MKYNKDMAIVVPSCDEYIDVVDEFLRLFHLNWPDCPFELILITQEREYIKDESISSYRTFKGAKWSDRIQKALENTECRYILNLIEDAFIGDVVDTQYVYQILDFIKKNDIKYYSSPRFEARRSQIKRNTEDISARKIRHNEPYGVNCLAEIWDRDELVYLFKKGIKTGWDVEYYFLRKTSANDSGVYEEYMKDCTNWLNIVHAIYAGEWTYDIKKLEKRGVSINKGNRKMMSLKNHIKEKLFHSINRHMPIALRKPIKRIASKAGYKFRSME